jgi:hypothetical protein
MALALSTQGHKTDLRQCIMNAPHHPEDRVRKGLVVTPTARVPDPVKDRVTDSLLPSQPPARPVIHAAAPVGAKGVVHWAVAVAFLYILIFIAITCPVIVLPWYPNAKISDVAGIYLTWPYWVVVAVMLVCQLALLVLPVRVNTRRPFTRRPLIIPVIVSGLMMGLLVVAMVFTFLELRWHLRRDPLSEGVQLFLVFVLPFVMWAGWAAFFFFLSRRQSIAGSMATQSSTLLTGSILELLIAIPTHIAARNRSECCAGIMSFFGLTLGISVMLFAFGPAVFFLYLARWRRLQARRGLRNPLAAEATENDVTKRWHGG